MPRPTTHIVASSGFKKPDAASFPKPFCAITLLKLFLGVLDGEGNMQETTRWCADLTEDVALSAWKREHPSLALCLKRYEVVSPVGRERRDLGERIELKDELLAASGMEGK